MKTEAEIRTKLSILKGMLQTYVEKLRETDYDTSSEYTSEYTRDLIGMADNAHIKIFLLQWVLE